MSESLSEQKLIISIGEARKLLGKDANSLSDAQVEKLILEFSAITGLYFKGVSS